MMWSWLWSFGTHLCPGVVNVTTVSQEMCSPHMKVARAQCRCWMIRPSSLWPGYDIIMLWPCITIAAVLFDILFFCLCQMVKCSGHLDMSVGSSRHESCNWFSSYINYQWNCVMTGTRCWYWKHDFTAVLGWQRVHWRWSSWSVQQWLCEWR